MKEREIKLQEMNRAQPMRSPSKTSLSQSDLMETDLATNSPSVTDQLNIDVTASEEGREPPVAEAKTPSGNNLTPVVPVATPSSPLLTSLLRSPTATSTSTPSATSTKITFNLGIFLIYSWLKKVLHCLGLQFLFRVPHHVAGS